MSGEEFVQFMLNVQLENPEVEFYELSETDNRIIQKLSEEKFKSREWNFGYSPKYSFHNNTEISGREIEIRMNVVKGIITEIEIGGDYFSTEETAKLTFQLQNTMHYFDDVQQILENIAGTVSDELVYVFF